MAATDIRIDPFPVFNFRVELDGLVVASFSEVSGLTADGDAIDYREGKDPTNNVRKLQGLRKYTPLMFKRGYVQDDTLWQWYRRIADGAYRHWREAMEWIWRRSGVEFVLKDIYPTDFAALQDIGHGIAGSPATVHDYLARLKDETGVNYVLCQMVFGDMKFADASHSISLFGREVMPAFA